ncbi:MAG: DUF1611 domain-containing protein [Actinomycetota bacterium]|nr:DUF1611 domain-containing protein [Actinomycetota bacterium]
MISFGDAQVKSTWVTRHVPTENVGWQPPRDPTVGDLLLCEVVSIGIHGRVETVSGSREKLYVGDRIVCAVANRYATSLLEAVAEVGDGEVDMISASGLCGRVVKRAKKAAAPTKLRVLGQAFVDGHRVNLRSCALETPPQPVGAEPQWVVVVGSAMDSGKTTACTSIIHGLVAAGHRVGAGKVTGTASARDLGSFRDAGAQPFLDFLDFGWPSTVGCTEAELLFVFDAVAGSMRAAGVQWGVIEIADGLLQADTKFLIGAVSTRLGPAANVVLTVRESLAAVAGVDVLHKLGLDVVAVSGLITNSPLACREVELAFPDVCVPTQELGKCLARGRVPIAPASVVHDEQPGVVTA